MLDNETKQQIIDLRKEGKTYNLIHDILGVAKSSISNICKSLGLGSNVVIKLITPEVIEKAQSLYDEIGNIKKVGEILGIGWERLAKVVKLKKKIRNKSDSDAVVDWRKRTKLKLIDYKGGKCLVCGYNKCSAALEFHHVNPEEKDFSISGCSKSFENLKTEVDKCVLVCSNCHKEIHAGITECPKI